MDPGPAPDPDRSPAAPGELAPVYLALRDGITRVVPGEHGMAPTAELPHAWGVMIDVGLPPGPVTVVAIADGTTSLYLGNGGATVGVGVLPHIAALGRELLATVDRAVETGADGVGTLAPAWEFPVPDAGRVHILALTYQGMLVARTTMAELDAPGHVLGRMWAAAGAIVGAIQALDVGPAADGVAVPPDRS